MKGRCIDEIVDYGDLPVFPEATTYPCILRLCSGSANPCFRATEVETLDFGRLKEYVEEKQAEIAAYNQGLGPEAAEQVNWRRLTNIGTLRAYIVNYLRHHPKIHQGMTLIVRQLDPSPQGLPIEIYAFTNTTAWVEYEGILSDIFDHILAIVAEFDLRVFQQPSGADLDKLGVESPPRV